MTTKITFYNFYLLITIFNIITFSLLYLFIPEIRDYFTREDNFMENLTVILFLESFIFGLFFLMRSSERASYKWYAILPCFGLIGVLDELSFGERIFDLTFPVIGGKKIDGLHDFISLLYYSIFRIDKIKIIIASLFILAIFIFFMYRYIKFFKLEFIENMFKTHQPLKFVIVLLFFALMAIFCDLEIIHFRGRVFLEELFEMNVALSLLFACFAIPK